MGPETSPWQISSSWHTFEVGPGNSVINGVVVNLPLCFIGWNLTRGILPSMYVAANLYIWYLYIGAVEKKGPPFRRIGVFTAFSVALVRSFPPFRKGHFFGAALKTSGGLFFSHGSTRQGTWRRSSAVAGYTWAASTEFFDPTGGCLEMLQKIFVVGGVQLLRCPRKLVSGL